MKKLILLLPSLFLLGSTLVAQWEWQYYKPTGNDLNDVQYLHSGIAVAVGEGGIILRSTDHGITWGIVDSGNGNTLNAAKFTDDLNGIAVGNSGEIARTTDAGASWSHDPKAGILPNYYDILIEGSLILLSNSYGILRSTDNGVTWNNIPIDSEVIVSHLAKQSENHFWGVGLYVFIESTDGGEHWISHFNSLGLRLYQSITFVDSMTGWIGGYFGILNDYDGYLFKTTDGGKTWTHTISDPYAFGIPDIAFADSVHGWYLTRGMIKYTSDGGNTWSIQQTEASPAKIAILDSSRVIIAGRSGQTYSTSDAGTTWTHGNPGKPARFRNVFFVNKNIGFIGSDKGLLKTSDGGNHYYDLPFPHGVEGLFFTDSLNGWVSISLTGGWGSIYHTTDGGISWSDQTGKILEIYDIYFTNSLHGFAVGNGEILLKTTDGGITWIDTAFGSGWLSTVKFYNHNLGWIAGSEIFTTTNGGMTWNKQEIHGVPDFSIQSLHIIDPNTLYAVGQNWLIIKTTNGGLDWYADTLFQNSVGGASMLDTWFLNPDTGWVSSYDGTFRTTDGGKTWFNEKLPAQRDINKIFVVNGHDAWFAGNNAVFHNSNVGPVTYPPDEVTVTTNKQQYFKDEIINVTITYWNNSDTTITLSFNTSCQYNYCICNYPVCLDSSWCRSYFRGCALVLTSVSIPAHESHTWKDTLSASFDYGTYILNGWVGDDDSAHHYGSGFTIFTITPYVSISIVQQRGWNLVSIPIDTTQIFKNDVFPGAVSSAFRYDEGYKMTNALVPGEGYWLKFDSAQIITLKGRPLLQDTIDVKTGWNLIGSISIKMDSSGMTSIPPGIITSIFHYDPRYGYESSTTIFPGQAFWLRASSPGKIILNGRK